MKRITPLIPLLLLLGLTLGCESELPTEADERVGISESENLMSQIKGVGTSSSTSPILTFADMEEVGNSVLVRSEDHVSAKLQTTGLVHNQIVTLWWVIFNNPEECSDGECGEPDVFNPAVQPSCLYADGGVVSGNGNIRYQDRLTIGEERNSCIDFFVDAVPELEGDDHGLLNPEGAEIHFVVRSHGPLKPGMVPEMRSTFAGGCEDFLDAGITPENSGECADLQFAVHMPPE